MSFHIALSLLCLSQSPVVDSLTTDSLEHHIQFINQAITKDLCIFKPDPGINIPFEKMKLLGEKFDKAAVSFTHNGMIIYAIVPAKLAERIDQDINGRRI